MSKRTLYIVLCVVLGILGQFVVHGVVETWYISLLTQDFERFSLGLSWGAWFSIHHVVSLMLLVFGACFGYWLGVYWWHLVYIERKGRGCILSGRCPE